MNTNQNISRIYRRNQSSMYVSFSRKDAIFYLYFTGRKIIDLGIEKKNNVKMLFEDDID